MRTMVPRTCQFCGTAFQIEPCYVRNGRGKFCSISCGLRMRETRHGHSLHNRQSRTYHSWANMKDRCNNPRSPKYYLYGGRGIQVCDRWLQFDNFLADMGERPEGMSLDRIDGSGNYSPDNCRWATPVEQQNNLRTNRRFLFQGEVRTLSEIMRMTGLKRDTLQYRLLQGWSDEQVAMPPMKGKPLSFR